jgi:ketosteroid isomerase-like protein
MTQPIVNDFIDALRGLEDGGDAAPLLDLFAGDCVLQNVSVADDFHGRDGAERFWAEDRGMFRDVQSDFRNVIVEDGRAALEWTRSGTGKGGDPVRYAGVSILELADGHIARFMAYFHPRELGRQAL